MSVDVLLGLQWGDEGKGKIVDVLTPRYDIITRFQGGPNAGHTIDINGSKHILHLIPSGIFHKDKINIIGNGVIIDPFILNKEISGLGEKGIDAFRNLYVSKKAHLILPSHRLLDAVYEIAKGKARIGSTLKGIGPAYTDKTGRNGIRIGETDSVAFQERYNALKEHHFRIISLYSGKWNEILIDGMPYEEYELQWLSALEQIKALKFIDGEYFINKAIADNKFILAEGAQGTMLDVDFGTYPFVTSSNTVCAGVCSGLGIAPHRIGRVFGIVKAYCTRVGSGPFPTELDCEAGNVLRDKGHEYGSTTGRPRRCGWLDLVALQYAIMLNGVTDLIMTKADVLDEFEHINVCTHYNFRNHQVDYMPYEIVTEEVVPVYDELEGWRSELPAGATVEHLPRAFVEYIRYIEKFTGIPFLMVSVGAERSKTLLMKAL